MRKDRTPVGGCATFTKEGIQNRRVKVNADLEVVAVEVWSSDGRFTVVNYYNPCLQLEMETWDGVMAHLCPPVVCIGEFNAHNQLWVSKNKDKNGATVEDFLDTHLFVMLNDGRATRF